MKTINWGIIGCGNVTEMKSGPAFNKVKNSHLVAVMRRNAAKAEDYAKRHEVDKWYSNAEELINDPNVNAVYIATPPSSHAELAIKALEAGKPVYVEKPMALNHQECVRMNEASKRFQTPLYVAYYRRSLPGFLKVKELIESGIIGAPLTVTLQLYKPLSEDEQSASKPWRVDPAISGGGHFVDLASHQLDYLDYLLGPATEVKSIAINQAGAYPVEDMVSASILFQNKVLLTGNWCFSVPEFLRRDEIEIIGEKGSLRFSSFNFVPIELKTGRDLKIFEYPRPEHVQLNLIQNVVDDLLGIGTCPSTGESAARTSLIMDKVLEEYYKSR